jgi:hypothetical protein
MRGGQRPKLIKSESEKGEITKNIKEIQGIIRDYFENIYSNKLENLEEMDKFQDTYDHPKLNQESINHLNRSITIKSLPKKKSPGPDRFSAEFYKIFKEELQHYLNFSTKQKGKEHCRTHSLKPILYSPQNWEKDTTKRENCRPIFLMNI